MNRLVIIFVIFSWNLGFSQNKGQNSIKIHVSNVEIAKYPLKDTTFSYVVNRFANHRIEFYNKEFDSIRLLPTFMHPFVATLHYGFAQHRPVVISPDMIWLMILQGFSKHIQLNSDSIQSSILNFTGKKTIRIRHNEFIKGNFSNNWQSTVPEITNQIFKDLKPELKPLFINEFSSSTPETIIAFQITLMEALNKYYDIHCMTSCGIPYVILEGKPDDWKWIRDNINQFKKYNLGFWTDSLYPILNKIYESSKGNIDTMFWKSMYKWNETSGGNKVTGWIIKFFPYLERQSDRKISPYLAIDYNKPQDENKFNFRGLSGDDFTSGISSCEFEWFYYSTHFNMQFNAGFIGISQNSNDLSLRPEINWFISEKAGTASNINDTIPPQPAKYVDKDYSNWIFADTLSAHNETEYIRACRNDYDTLFYDITSNPDEYPIFQPKKNKTFQEGWNDFLNYSKNNPIRTSRSGKVKFSFLVTPSGKCIIYKPINDPDNLFWAASSFISDCPKWKPGKKNGKKVIVKMIAEIDIIE